LNFIFKLANNADRQSLATKARRKRFAFFQELIGSLERPISILDIGGTEQFWETMEFGGESGVEISILNIKAPETRNPNFHGVSGDARDLSQFEDKSFDVIFSNSVIEHVGGYDDQVQMANEIMRVGKRYFVQTPNKYFPIEPHFLLPYFQFYPVWFRIALMRRFALGYAKAPMPDYDEAKANVTRIRLLSQREVRKLFPGAKIYHERLGGLTKSFVAYDGWGPSS